MATSKWWLRRNRIVDPPVPDEPEDDGPASTTTADVGLADLTKSELVARAEAAGLDTSGTKSDLVERMGGAAG